MSKLIITVDFDWIKSKRAECGNIIRKMEGFVKTIPNVKLIKSDSDSLTVEMPEEDREKAMHAIAKQIGVLGNEPKIWQYIRMGGDCRDLTIPTDEEPVKLDDAVREAIDAALEAAEKQTEELERRAKEEAKKKEESSSREMSFEEMIEESDAAKASEMMAIRKRIVLTKKLSLQGKKDHRLRQKRKSRPKRILSLFQIEAEK